MGPDSNSMHVKDVFQEVKATLQLFLASRIAASSSSLEQLLPSASGERRGRETERGGEKMRKAESKGFFF